MLLRRPFLLLPLMAFLTAWVDPVPAPAVVAVAASAADALHAMAQAYQATGHPAPRLVVGATGAFYQQITAGAPIDLLFAADDTYTSKLAAAGFTVSRRRYARGLLALWAPTGGVDVRRGWAALTDKAIRHVAIANPAVAPYGQAAVAALRHAGLYATLAPRLVLGESAAQAAQFVTTGGAEAGLLPLSLAVAPALASRGRYWSIPAQYYPPLNAEVVLLKGGYNGAEARSFLAFSAGAAALSLLRHAGFDPVIVP